MLIPHGDIVDAITPINILFRGGGEFCPLMKIKMMVLMMVMMMMIIIMIMIMIMTIVSVEQRPGWGEHVINPSFPPERPFDGKKTMFKQRS